MAEQQLVDYITKAKAAGQTDEQSRNLLYKNGWTEQEVNEAFTEIMPKVQVQPEGKPQIQANISPTGIDNLKVQPQAQPQPQEIIQQKPIVQQPKIQNQPAQPTVQNNVMIKRTGSHKLLRLLIVLLIVIALGAVGVFAIMKNPNILSGMFSPNPNTVIAKMLTNMSGVKIYQTTALIEMGIIKKSDKSTQGKLTANVNSEIDATDANNAKADGNLILNLTLSGSSISANISVTVINNATYLKINDIVLPSSYTNGVDIAKIKGIWMKIDQDSFNTLQSQSPTGLVDSSTTFETTKTTQSEFAKKVANLISTEKLLSIDKQFADETINGKNTYHYSVKISKAKMTDLFSKIVALETQDSQSIGNSALYINMANAFVKTIVDAVGDINIELWIGKIDYMLYQVKLNKIIDAGKFDPSADMQMEIRFTANNSNFNKAITIQAPENFQKIEDVLMPIMKIQEIVSDMRQIGIGASQALILNSNYLNVCRMGYVNAPKSAPYSQALIFVVKDLMSKGATNPICVASSDNYCVSTQLPDKSYMCVGVGGVLGTVQCVSPQTVCK